MPRCKWVKGWITQCYNRSARCDIGSGGGCGSGGAGVGGGTAPLASPKHAPEAGVVGGGGGSGSGSGGAGVGGGTAPPASPKLALETGVVGGGTPPPASLVALVALTSLSGFSVADRRGDTSLPSFAQLNHPGGGKSSGDDDGGDGGDRNGGGGGVDVAVNQSAYARACLVSRN